MSKAELGPLARLARLAYTGLYLPAFPFVFGYWMTRPDSRGRLGEYLGGGGRSMSRGGNPQLPIWVHAVSVGETVAVMPLLARLARRGMSFFLTTTISDAESVAGRYGVGFQATSFLPLDVPAALDRLIEHVRPRAFLVSETDLWPNLLLGLREREVPCYLVNGRISTSMARTWRSLRVLGAPALDALRLAFVQGTQDRDRLVEMGLPGDRVRVVGNTKYELGEPPPLPPDSRVLAERLPEDARLVLVAGSTHAPEEAHLLEALKACPGRAPRLVLVPRNPRRSEEVLALARSAGRSAESWSSLLADPSRLAATEVVVVDAMGLLSGLYGFADLAYVGGGFAPGGGHNFLEAAWHGLPILGGPGWRNFESDVVAFETARAFVRCHDATGIQDAVWRLLEDPGERAAMGERARAFLDASGTASAETEAAILEDLASARSVYLAAASLT